MSRVKFKRFTKPGLLKKMGRQLLGRFLAKFEDQLAANNVALPATELEDEGYFKTLSRLAMAPEGLPEEMVEAMHSVEAMANEAGEDRLRRAAAEKKLDVKFADDSSREDIALQFYLVDEAAFAEKHNEHRLIRLSSFVHFSSKTPGDRRGTFAAPDGAAIQRMTDDMNEWFKKNSRGDKCVLIEVYPIEGEYWFMIRHGDTYARVPTIEGGRVAVRHFRPTKDDVAVYSPERDEIRIHAGTKGEAELYRSVIGMRLFGDDGYFSQRKTYTLDALRNDGVDALDTTGIVGIRKIVLREVEVTWDGGFSEVVVRKADDVFAAAAARSAKAIPDSGRITRAVLDFYFGEAEKPRKVTVRTPNVLKLGRYCDARLVHEWLSKRGFRTSVNAPRPRGGIMYVKPLALS